jgi:hypothetical protein
MLFSKMNQKTNKKRSNGSNRIDQSPYRRLRPLTPLSFSLLSSLLSFLLSLRKIKKF